MTDKALTVANKDELLAQYGTDDEVVSLAERIKKTFPGGSKLSDFQLVAFAQYCRVTDTNPWRGEAYPFVDYRGQFHVIDGYKALVRWAKRQAEYADKFEPLTSEIKEGDIGYRCWILRHDAMSFMRQLIDAGMTSREAFEIAATSAVGVVAKREQFKKNGQPIQPPTGWTWDERARTRALKNALNKSHGAPSPKELAEGSWMVNGTKTIPDDWKTTTPKMPAYEREAIAEGSAHHRAAHKRAQAAMKAGKTADDATDELFGDYVDVDPVLVRQGDFSGAPPDPDSSAEYQEFLEEEAEIIEQTAAMEQAIDAGTHIDLDYAPDWIDTDEPGRWADLRAEACRHLGYSHDNHVKNTLKQLVSEEDRAMLTYRTAWHLLQEHQRSKEEGE